MDPFIFWDKNVNEKQCANDVNIFMDHYEIPAFETPNSSADTAINAFFQAKYGMFYCKDGSKIYG